MNSKPRFQEFNGALFKIVQPNGPCCESGCDGCELYTYKKKNGVPLKNSRTEYYEKLTEKVKKE